MSLAVGPRLARTHWANPPLGLAERRGLSHRAIAHSTARSCELKFLILADSPSDLPDGLFAGMAVQSLLQKYFVSRLTQITFTTCAIPAHTEGRFAIVTNVWRGMRWTLAVR